MESIYYVLSWACHRRCKHCYDSRFRPYVGEALQAVQQQAMANHVRIIDHFPPTMQYRDLAAPLPAGGYAVKTGRIILSGGEVLLDPIRTTVTYPVIERLQARYAQQGGVKIIVQTTGDLLTDAIVSELLARGVYMISVASIDDYHVGIAGPQRQQAFIAKLRALFERHGMRNGDLPAAAGAWHEQEGPLYGFFGAAPDTWIGKLWPRGRAWDNSLPRSSLEDNFCQRWSGGIHFLRHQDSGSEVSVEPDGKVYPCCVKTKLPIGNLLEEPLIPILDSLADEPAYMAIDRGEPQTMGLAYGWGEARMRASAHTSLPDGSAYQNLCIACDRFHEAVLGPVLARARARRLGQASNSSLPTD